MRHLIAVLLVALAWPVLARDPQPSVVELEVQMTLEELIAWYSIHEPDRSKLSRAVGAAIERMQQGGGDDEGHIDIVVTVPRSHD